MTPEIGFLEHPAGLDEHLSKLGYARAEQQGSLVRYRHECCPAIMYAPASRSSLGRWKEHVVVAELWIEQKLIDAMDVVASARRGLVIQHVLSGYRTVWYDPVMRGVCPQPKKWYTTAKAL